MRENKILEKGKEMNKMLLDKMMEGVLMPIPQIY